MTRAFTTEEARIVALEAEIKRMRIVYRRAVMWTREYNRHQFPRYWRRPFEENLAAAVAEAEKARTK